MSDGKKVEVESFTDKAGQTVKRGDYIVYGSLLGRCAALKFGKVINIKCGPGYYNNDSLLWSITVASIEHSWGTDQMEPCEKNGTLQFPNRIVKFDNLPQNYKNLLDSV